MAMVLSVAACFLHNLWEFDMKTRILFSTMLLASSFALIPHAHAYDPNDPLSVQSSLDSVSKSIQNEEGKIKALQDKYAGAPARERAKLQKRIDTMKSDLKQRQEKLQNLRDKYKNLASDKKAELQKNIDDRKQQIKDLRDKYKNAPAEQKQKIKDQVDAQKKSWDDQKQSLKDMHDSNVQAGKDFVHSLKGGF
ncbi:hypothetical protein BG621_03485 [Parasaccharibacter apium]|nr:hypothetical protein BG621_03485 [Parasaccharibacter apium]